MPVEKKDEKKDEEKEGLDVDESEEQSEQERKEFIKEFLEERKMYNEDDDWDTGGQGLGETTTEETDEDITKAGFHLEENKENKEKI